MIWHFLSSSYSNPYKRTHLLTVILTLSCAEFRDQTTVKKHVMKAALLRGVKDGTLIQVKNSYKLSPEAKKAAAKPKAKKATAAKKKAAPKKKVRTDDDKSQKCSPICFLSHVRDLSMV